MAQQSSGWVSPDNESSNIKFIKWDEEVEPNLKKVLTVEFQNGKKYEYYGVTKETFKEFKSAPSAGRYLNEHIKDKYEHTKL